MRMRMVVPVRRQAVRFAAFPGNDLAHVLDSFHGAAGARVQVNKSINQCKCMPQTLSFVHSSCHLPVPYYFLALQ